MTNSEARVKENRLAIQSTIAQCDQDLHNQKEKKKEIELELAEYVGDFQESVEIRELHEQIDELTKKLNAKLSQDADFITMSERKAAINLEIKDTKEVLSSHVVQWKMDTHEDAVEIGNNLGKQIIVKGTLGKPQAYQTNIFSSDGNKEKLKKS